ncbi:dipeptidase [Halorubrum gandharaense]
MTGQDPPAGDDHDATHHDPPIIDGHNDTLLRCTDPDRLAETAGEGVTADESFLEGAVAGSEHGGGHLDLPRAREAGLSAGLFAAFVLNERDPESPADDVDYGAGGLPPAVGQRVSEAVVLEQFGALHRWDRASDEFLVVESVDDLDACLEGEALGAIPHVEGAAGIRTDLANLDLWYAAGLRSVGLVWSRPNDFAHGVPFAHDTGPDVGPGLTDAGKALVRACNDRGILVDCAHLNAAGVDDVLATTDDPPVISHTCAHGICPNARNVTDEQLRRIGERDGLVGLSLSAAFLHPKGGDPTGDEADGGDDSIDSHDPVADVDLDLIVDHLDRFVEHAGIESVALGSDFDGATLPDCIGDVTDLRRILDRLRGRGYTENEVERIAFRNWRRVLAETWG